MQHRRGHKTQGDSGGRKADGEPEEKMLGRREDDSVEPGDRTGFCALAVGGHGRHSTGSLRGSSGAGAEGGCLHRCNPAETHGCRVTSAEFVHSLEEFYVTAGADPPGVLTPSSHRSATLTQGCRRSPMLWIPLKQRYVEFAAAWVRVPVPHTPPVLESSFDRLESSGFDLCC